MKKLVIDRQRWYRGQGSINSCLLSIDGLMCCLGFYCIKEGISETDIFEVGRPSRLTNAFEQDAVKKLLNADIEQSLVVTNDHQGIDETTREIKIKDLFKKIDYEVEFIN